MLYLLHIKHDIHTQTHSYIYVCVGEGERDREVFLVHKRRKKQKQNISEPTLRAREIYCMEHPSNSKTINITFAKLSRYFIV